MKVKIKLDEGAFMPKREHKTDAGADVRTPKGFTIQPKCSHEIHTGIHIETPSEYVTLVMGKSGLWMKYGIITNGVVDEGYDGEVIIKIMNLGPFPVDFDRGDKIAQLLIMPVIYPDFESVESIKGGDRGSDGFGSTGR